MADLSVVMDKLHGFESETDLAEFFRGYGLKAKPRDSSACAISQFVTEETGLHISTGPSSVIVMGFSRSNFPNSFKNTLAMSNFVINYDNGVYSDLVKEGYEVIDTRLGSVWL